MKQVIKVKDKKQHYNLWLTLFQSGSNITDREKSVLIELLIRRSELSETGIYEPFLAKLLFDTDSKKIICYELDISGYSYANAIKALKEKGIIEEDGTIRKQLIPENILEFEFKYDNK